MRRRRRRNPEMIGNSVQLIELAMFAVAGYAFYKYVWPLLSGLGSGIKTATTAVANTVATPIASAYVALTAGPNIVAAGSVVLSTGEEVPIANIGVPQPFLLADGTQSASFNYKGQKWQFTGPSDETGTYYAVPYTGS